ncbi:hypothetical protein AGLY_015090 [Aphis glycines]|uniref:Uncharacterized protein n=1 Tax=Aphis glycines TaxID=307491 RepID=A0A6G0T1X5_APHGL|nr:hypothetical protein AGLY_015090 [Aphis glycines]
MLQHIRRSIDRLNFRFRTLEHRLKKYINCGLVFDLVWYNKSGTICHRHIYLSMCDCEQLFSLIISVISVIVTQKQITCSIIGTCDLFRVPPETMDGSIRVSVAGNKDDFFEMWRPLMRPPATLAGLTNSSSLLSVLEKITNSHLVKISSTCFKKSILSKTGFAKIYSFYPILYNRYNTIERKEIGLGLITKNTHTLFKNYNELKTTHANILYWKIVKRTTLIFHGAKLCCVFCRFLNIRFLICICRLRNINIEKNIVEKYVQLKSNQNHENILISNLYKIRYLNDKMYLDLIFEILMFLYHNFILARLAIKHNTH